MLKFCLHISYVAIPWLATIWLATQRTVAAEAADEPTTRRALVVSGLPGDKEHRRLFADSVSKIKSALTSRLGFLEANVHVQFGRDSDGAPLEGIVAQGRATRQEIRDAATRLSNESSAQDTIWIFLIGHSHVEDGTVYFNIPDTDITQREVGEVFAGLSGRQVVFFVCLPASNLFVRALSRQNRIVMTACESEVETNESVFHVSLANTLLQIKNEPAFDVDQNGVVSLLDVYLKANQDLADAYLRHEPPLVATEHPLFDDDGDGRGSELQLDYLTVEQGGRLGEPRISIPQSSPDGSSTAAVPLFITD